MNIKIQKKEMSLNYGAWDYIFSIIPPKDIKQIDFEKYFAKWCSTNFKQNYIFHRTNTIILSGGCSDNKKYYWKPHNNGFNEYELRCDTKDALLLKMTYEETNDE